MLEWVTWGGEYFFRNTAAAHNGNFTGGGWFVAVEQTMPISINKHFFLGETLWSVIPNLSRKKPGVGFSKTRLVMVLFSLQQMRWTLPLLKFSVLRCDQHRRNLRATFSTEVERSRRYGTNAYKRPGWLHRSLHRRRCSRGPQPSYSM